MSVTPPVSAPGTSWTVGDPFNAFQELLGVKRAAYDQRGMV